MSDQSGGKELRVEVLPVAALKPYERNTRKHQKDDVEAICESIRRYGFNDPIGIWGDENLIVEGHGRLMAAKELGMETVPCIRLDHLTEQQRREYAIAHNRTAELSAWDKKMLAAELPGLDMIAFGFGIDPKEDLQAQEDVFDCAAEAPLRAEYGSLWKLGGCRLLVGDSSNPADVLRLTDGAQIDLLLTDPPYGVSYEAKAGKIINDDLNEEGLADLLEKSLRNAAAVMRPGGCYYVWMGNRTLPVLLHAMGEAGLSYRQLLVWVKNQAPLSRLDYHANHEVCLEAEQNSDVDFGAYGWTDGAAHTFRYDHKQKTVLEFPKPQKSTLHPTMKPVPLFDYQIKANTNQGDNVLDLFAGSGTTLIACQQNGRNAYLMELDPKYADRIIARWEALTGKKAERIDNEEEK